MVEQLIVPVDGSSDSWRTVRFAASLAARCDAAVEVLGIAISQTEAEVIERELDTGVAGIDTSGRQVDTVVQVREFVAAAIADRINAHPGAQLVMSSSGRGRSAAVLGSTAADTLARTLEPILVVGPSLSEPACRGDQLDGPVLVTVDGSDASETVLELGARWASLLDDELWIVKVNDPATRSSADVAETGHSEDLANQLADATGRGVQFEALHGRQIATTVAEHAEQVGASMVVAATHGRTGLARLVIGSTAEGFVRRCHCPVLLQRPPHLGVWPE